MTTTPRPAAGLLISVLRLPAVVLFWPAFACMVLAWGVLLVTAQLAGFLGRCAGHGMKTPAPRPWSEP